MRDRIYRNNNDNKTYMTKVDTKQLGPNANYGILLEPKLTARLCSIFKIHRVELT